MRIEIRADSVLIEGYVNAVARDSRPMRDRKTGKRFVEQIVPGVFERALRHNEVQLYLNHDRSRVLGSTSTNLELHEDSIGLHARAEVTDPEVIDKARKKKLRGWSFGFRERDASTEAITDAMERRYVEDMELIEVSIVDERKLPCYEGTSLEVRAEGETVLTPEPLEVRADYVEVDTPKPPTDMSKYHNRIKELEKETAE
ncbi:MAG: HK97 family phage prohead protease [Enterocloster asparagiformis]|nr:HK97 family phage prohead protease [Enterocloster asparagiformis]DAZ84154.1 MAG TPA: prohead serine protease [Caudoviricetes sp.]